MVTMVSVGVYVGLSVNSRRPPTPWRDSMLAGIPCFNIDVNHMCPFSTSTEKRTKKGILRYRRVLVVTKLFVNETQCLNY